MIYICLVIQVMDYSNLGKYSDEFSHIRYRCRELKSFELRCYSTPLRFRGQVHHRLEVDVKLTLTFTCPTVFYNLSPDVLENDSFRFRWATLY